METIVVGEFYQGQNFILSTQMI